jgi:4-hydroxy-tetrahydrodipicolinate synthase
MFEAWESGDFETARAIHYGLHPLVDLLFVETNPAPAKWVLADLGLISSPHVRPPLIEPNATVIESIKQLRAEAAELVAAPIGAFS